MKPRRSRLATLRFIFIAVVFMLLADHFIFGGKRSYIEAAKTRPVEENAAVKVPPVKVMPPDGKKFFEADISVAPKTPSPKPSPPERGKGFKKKEAAARIAIIIDDVGMDVRRSREAIDLPAPVTLAMLPYAPKVRELAQEAKAKGHGLIIHVPMEAMDPGANIGPGGLKAAMGAAEMDAAFQAMLDSFEGYEGINNHMGSRLTQDKTAMDRVMAALATRHLFFIDSKTAGGSVGGAEAASSGVPYAERDVFIDHVETLEFAKEALRHTEEIAVKRGYAIAIGHPKDNTLAALKAWMPTLAAKGIALVPVKALLIVPAAAVAAEAGMHGSHEENSDLGEGRVDPRLRGDDEGKGGYNEDKGGDKDKESGGGDKADEAVDLFPADGEPSYQIPVVEDPAAE